MFAVISNIEKIPNVCEVCSNENFLREKMEQIAINYGIDHVGKKNWINSLEDVNKNVHNELSTFTIYPYILLQRVNENEIKVFRVTKELMINRGWIYNSEEYKYEKKEIGSFFFVVSDNWKNQIETEKEVTSVKKEIIHQIKKSETTKLEKPVHSKTFTCFDDVMNELKKKYNH